MNIALDATPLSTVPGGIARYTGELARALAGEFPEDRFWLLSDQPFGCIANGRPNLRCGRAPENVLERRWWSWGLPREIARTGAELFHGTDFAVPYRNACASVMTVHDLSPWRETTAGETSGRVRRRASALLRLGRPTMVITPTKAIRGEVITRFGFDERRVVVVPLAASDTFQRQPLPDGRGSVTRPYFLHVGAIQPRKNLAVIVEAWRELKRSHEVDLILAGPVRNRAACPPPEPGLTVLENESDEDLARLYSSAVACLLPSSYEGFGLPVLEAMQCGCPVIASRDPALMEVSGGAAEHVDCSDARAWRAALERLLTDSGSRACMRERGLARAADSSWPRTARLTREVYAEALRRFRG